MKDQCPACGSLDTVHEINDDEAPTIHFYECMDCCFTWEVNDD